MPRDVKANIGKDNSPKQLKLTDFRVCSQIANFSTDIAEETVSRDSKSDSNEG